MRFATTSLVTLAAVSSALAQTVSPEISSAVFAYLSPTCQSTVLDLIKPNTSFFSCFRVDVILGIALSNASIVPGLDVYATDICNSAPCSNTTLTNVSSSIISGCASDLAKAGVTNVTVTDIVDLYPLAREIFCLKTDLPFNGTNASIPITHSTYNTTNGTFCVTSLLTELTAYTGSNLTNAFADSLVIGANATALHLIEASPRTALCSDCIFAALDLIEEAYPQAGSIQVGSNVTINQYLNGTCNATGYHITTNGTLPSTIEEVSINSTFPLNITESNKTYAPDFGTTPLPNTTAGLNATQVSAVSSEIATATSGVVPSAVVGGNTTVSKRRWLGKA